MTREHIVEDIKVLAQDSVMAGTLDEEGAEVIVECLTDALEGFFPDGRKAG